MKKTVDKIIIMCYKSIKIDSEDRRLSMELMLKSVPFETNPDFGEVKDETNI